MPDGLSEQRKLPHDADLCFATIENILSFKAVYVIIIFRTVQRIKKQQHKYPPHGQSELIRIRLRLIFKLK